MNDFLVYSFLLLLLSKKCSLSSHITFIMPQLQANNTPNIQLKYHINMNPC